MTNLDVTAQSHISLRYFATYISLRTKKYEKTNDFVGKEVIFELCKESFLVS
jgi:hypothetical protein